jgi:hypothetical protein
VTVYRINKWETAFETSESRKYLALRWVALPISFSSNGYQSMLDEFGDDAAALYGAWCALCSFAGTCEIRGVLATSRGVSVRTSHIARITGFPAALFDRLIEWAARDEIRWVCAVPDDELGSMLADNPNKKKRKNDSPEDSPGSLPVEREKVGSTEHNLTEHNLTKPNITKQYQTAAPVTPGPASKDDLVDRWKRPTRNFLDLVDELAKRFGNEKIVRRIKSHIDRDYIYRIAWVGAEFDREVVDTICASMLRSPSDANYVQNPLAYADKLMRDLCAQHGHEWKALRSLVPPPPPPVSSKVAIMEEVNA